MKEVSETINCSICARVTPLKYSERHHLTPYCKKGKLTVLVCIDCGNQIHKLFTISELTHQYNTLETLLNHPSVQTWVCWIRKRKEFGFCMKGKKRKL
jgi:hypothetical protein